MKNETMPRRHDIDWLRVIATYLLFFFHVAMVFNPAPFYHIRNTELSFVVLVVAGFISLWHMPLFFLLAGWSLFASIEARGVRGMLWERLFKLWIPLVAACTLLMPPIKYVELRSGLDLNYTGLYVAPWLQAGFRQIIATGLPVAPPFDESFTEFLPTFFTRLDRFTWAHMWFVAYLLAFTVAYLPLFAWLRRSRIEPAPATAAWVYAPIVPLALIQLVLRPHWPGLQNLYDDWANVAYYSIYLLAGFTLARCPALEPIIHRECTRALAIGGIAVGGLLLAVLGVLTSPAVLLVGSAVAGWCFVLAALGLAHRHLRFSGTIHRYLTESAFPVYVLHQFAIVVPGYFLLRLPLGIVPKFALLLAVAVATTLAAYHLAVRRSRVLRVLLGMKPLARPSGDGRALRPAGRAPAAGAAVAGTVMIGLLVTSTGAVATRGGTMSVAPVPGNTTTSPGTASPEGIWYAEGGAAKVEIVGCGEALCGRVVWLRSPFDENGCELRDANNPDERLRERPVLGLEILGGLTREGGDGWAGGWIYDPGSGHTYRAAATLDGENRLRLRGFVGIPLLGRTTSWIREGTETALCRSAS